MLNPICFPIHSISWPLKGSHKKNVKPVMAPSVMPFSKTLNRQDFLFGITSNKNCVTGPKKLSLTTFSETSICVKLFQKHQVFSNFIYKFGHQQVKATTFLG